MSSCVPHCLPPWWAAGDWHHTRDGAAGAGTCGVEMPRSWDGSRVLLLLQGHRLGIPCPPSLGDAGVPGMPLPLPHLCQGSDLGVLLARHVPACKRCRLGQG